MCISFVTLLWKWMMPVEKNLASVAFVYQLLTISFVYVPCMLMDGLNIAPFLNYENLNYKSILKNYV